METESALDWYQAKALLEWYVELGVTDAISEAPINRYEVVAEAATKPIAVPAPPGAPKREPVPEPVVIPARDWVAEATAMAAQAKNLEELAEAMRGFEGSELKRGARNFVFADGNPAARVMIVGEAPGAEEDAQGLPFVGKAGDMLNRMFAAIGMGRDVPSSEKALYITNAMPWRPPGNRRPTADEVKMFHPFLARHIEIVAPEVLVIMGNTALFALTGNEGITRARGKWIDVARRPALPMFHPSFLDRTPIAKREAWADLLSLQAKLREIAS